MIQAVVTATMGSGAVNTKILQKLRSWLLDTAQHHLTQTQGGERKYLVNLQLNIGRMLRRAGESSYKEAEDLFSEVYKQKHEAGEDDALVLEALQELVVLLVAQGEQRYQEAEERCAKLIEARKRPGEAADKLVFALGQQASLLIKQSKHKEALGPASEAWQISYS